MRTAEETLEKHLCLRRVCVKGAKAWRHRNTNLAFLLPESGTAQYVCGRIQQTLSPGDLMVMDGRRGGMLLAVVGQLVFLTFCLSLEHLFPLFSPAEIALLDGLAELPNGFKHYPASSAAARTCRELLTAAPEEYSLDHRVQLLRVAAVVLTEECQAARSRRAEFVRMEDHVAQVLRDLSVEDLLQASIEQLAARFGCGQRHLNRLFHQHLGLSAGALRMEARLQKALSLLRNPNAKVINVAEQCGFNHLGLFNTCFRKRFGTSPGQWRKQAAAEQQRPLTSLRELLQASDLPGPQQP